MKAKLTFWILSILCLVSVFSIGFASWIVVNPLEPSQYDDAIDTIVYEAYDNAQYIEILDSTALEYYNTGFVVNKQLTKTGQITVNFKFNVNKYKEYLSTANEQIDANGITFVLTLKHASNSAGLDFFADSSPFTITSEVSGLTGSSIIESGSTAKINLTSLPNDSTVDFNVTFKFTYKGLDFKTDVFQYIENVRFAVEAKIIKE